MANETIITVIGNLTADPELRYTQNGKAVAGFTIASTPRTFDRQANEWKDGDALFLRSSAWGDLGEHVAGSLTKGSRVIVQGRLKQRSYDDREGNKRTSIELEIDEIGPSLRYATAAVTRASAGGQRDSGSWSDAKGTWERQQGSWSEQLQQPVSTPDTAPQPQWDTQGGNGGQAGAQGSWATAGQIVDAEVPF